jgi:hypothetical protein
LKQKSVHEFKEMIIVTAYLAIFFCALATYTMLLVGKSELAYSITLRWLMRLWSLKSFS